MYFAIKSHHLSAADIAARVGLQPDRVTIRGSRRGDPPVPSFHGWKVVCDAPARSIDEQVRSVLDRLRPHETALTTIVRSPDCSGVLQVVRFLDQDGDDAGAEAHLLGWHLGPEDLAFLVRLDVPIDVDEYR